MNLLGDAAFDLIDLLLVELGHLLDGPFPSLDVVLLILIRGNHKEEALVVDFTVLVDVACELAHDFNLGLD